MQATRTATGLFRLTKLLYTGQALRGTNGQWVHCLLGHAPSMLSPSTPSASLRGRGGLQLCPLYTRRVEAAGCGGTAAAAAAAAAGDLLSPPPHPPPPPPPSRLAGPRSRPGPRPPASASMRAERTWRSAEKCGCCVGDAPRTLRAAAPPAAPPCHAGRPQLRRPVAAHHPPAAAVALEHWALRAQHPQTGHHCPSSPAAPARARCC